MLSNAALKDLHESAGPFFCVTLMSKTPEKATKKSDEKERRKKRRKKLSPKVMMEMVK